MDNPLNVHIYPVLTFCFVLTVQSAAQVTFIGTELLGRPTDHSITLNIVADAAIQAYAEYGTTSGVYPDATTTVSAAANEPIELLMMD